MGGTRRLHPTLVKLTHSPHTSRASCSTSVRRTRSLCFRYGCSAIHSDGLIMVRPRCILTANLSASSSHFVPGVTVIRALCFDLGSLIFRLRRRLLRPIVVGTFSLSPSSSPSTPAAAGHICRLVCWYAWLAADECPPSAAMKRSGDCRGRRSRRKFEQTHRRDCGPPHCHQVVKFLCLQLPHRQNVAAQR